MIDAGDAFIIKPIRQELRSVLPSAAQFKLLSERRTRVEHRLLDLRVRLHLFAA